MKFAIYRTVMDHIDLPNSFGPNPAPKKVIDYLDQNNLWPSLIDGEEKDDMLFLKQVGYVDPNA